MFLGDIPKQAQFFNTVRRWQIGAATDAGPSPAMAVLITVLATTLRVLTGLALAAVGSLVVGVAIRFWILFGNLTLPTIRLLAPVSPVAWLPVAIFVFGIGNAPAIFMVFIALFFIMTLATITQIDSVAPNYLNVARTMGASKRQIYLRVILPAILPGLLVVLRLNLLGAWMVVLIAETTGVGYGLGQMIMLARNTFNPSLVFFTIFLLGVIGFVLRLRATAAAAPAALLGPERSRQSRWRLIREPSATTRRRLSASASAKPGTPAPAERPLLSPASTSRWRPASSSCFSGRPAVARARCST